LYGAGDEKIGSIVGGTANDGKELKARFLSSTPSLKRLITNVKRASKKGYLKGLDGRKIWMRQNETGVMEHKALNTLLQCAGAVVMKKSSCILDGSVKKHTLDVLKVIDMHDEAQADVLIKDVDKYCELAVDSIVKAGEHFNLKCPLAAEAKIGDNWAQTH
jgi:DNA polymerase I-like protein with 3'-5' exonuclease and polymerase domains